MLSEFRTRVLEGGLDSVIFDVLVRRLGELGLLSAGGRQRSDSTHVLGAVRSLNRLELAGETVRAALEALAAAAPQWLAGVIDPSWTQVYGARIENLRLPGSETKRAAPGSTGVTATACSTPSPRRARRTGWSSCPRWRPCARSGSSSTTATTASTGSRCSGGRPKNTVSRPADSLPRVVNSLVLVRCSCG